MNTAWCCCSSKRCDTIVRKTLMTLYRAGFRDTLYVVVPFEEMADYIAALTASPIYTRIIGSEKGLVKQRTTFRNLFPEGQRIVFCDDDLTNIKRLSPSSERATGGTPLGSRTVAPTEQLHNARLQPITDIHAITESFFDFTEAQRALLWSVYPVMNPLFMRARISVGSCYCVGAFYGIINDHRLVEPAQDECEDYARQLAEQAAGRPPLRFEYVGIETRYFKNAGGLQQARNPETRKATIQTLLGHYPSLIAQHDRKDGTPDLKFRVKPLHFDPSAIPCLCIDLPAPAE